jgi:hypothetical protein
MTEQNPNINKSNPENISPIVDVMTSEPAYLHLTIVRSMYSPNPELSDVLENIHFNHIFRNNSPYPLIVDEKTIVLHNYINVTNDALGFSIHDTTIGNDYAFYYTVIFELSVSNLTKLSKDLQRQFTKIIEYWNTIRIRKEPIKFEDNYYNGRNTFKMTQEMVTNYLKMFNQMNDAYRKFANTS